MKDDVSKMTSSFYLRISGTVQGVFFRASAKKKADALGVLGWIRNTGDHCVESKVSGKKDAVLDFIEWCKTGPVLASVTEVIVQACEDQHMDDFVIADTEVT
ncbi:MAG: acylphosphatase [Chitinophagaceae bacterium]